MCITPANSYYDLLFIQPPVEEIGILLVFKHTLGSLDDITRLLF